MPTIEDLYKAGLSIREVARQLERSYETVRWQLVARGLHRVQPKATQNGSAACNRCKEQKAISEFPFFAYGDYRCRSCLRAANHEAQLRRNGSSATLYQSLWDAQEGQCAICGASEGHRSQYDRVCRFALDHNHQTGKPRGLLCNSCNRGLGRFKDSVANLEAAIRYLQREQ